MKAPSFVSYSRLWFTLRPIVAWVAVSSVFYLIAFNTGAGWLYLFASLLLAALPLSFLWNRLSIRALLPTLTAPNRLCESERAELKIMIGARGFLPKVAFEGILQHAGRTLGFFFPYASRHKPAVLELAAHFKRGVYKTSTLDLKTTGPLGLLGASRRISLSTPLVVTPRLYPLKSDWVHTSGGVREGQERFVPTRSRSADYLGTRNWRDGDPVSAIHWRTTARRGRFIVVERAEPVHRVPLVLVDTFHKSHFSQEEESTFEVVVRLAATLIAREVTYGRPFALDTHVSPAKTCNLQADLEGALTWLAQLKPSSREPLTLLQAPKGLSAGLAPVVITSAHEGLLDLLERGKYLKDSRGTLIAALPAHEQKGTLSEVGRAGLRKAARESGVTLLFIKEEAQAAELLASL